MFFEWTHGSIWIVSATLLTCVGCGGGNALPVGGPFGGTLDPAVVVDGGILSDSSGVLDQGPVMTAPISGVPTWTDLYQTYMVVGSLGNCALGGCHDGNMDNPSEAFGYLKSQGYVGGPDPALVVPGSSCLSWVGASGLPMPPNGETMNAMAMKDFQAWAAAGAKNN